jgi:hypothetical protein
MTFLSARQLGDELGIHATELLPWASIMASGTDRVAKTASCLCRISRATSGEDATTVVTVPRWRDMSGP